MAGRGVLAQDDESGGRTHRRCPRCTSRLPPNEAAAHADALVAGDAGRVWRDVLNDAAEHHLKPVYASAVGVAHPGARPRRDLYRGKRYLPVALLQFGRGCTDACAYCATGAYSGSRHYVRRIDEVLAEIEASGRKSLFFVDDNIVSDTAAAKDLFRELAGLRVRWVSQASLDMTRDAELMDLMAGSGCLGHVVGFESLVALNLESVGKVVNYTGVANAYRNEIRVLRDYGLQTWAAFTLGYDEDTTAGIDHLLEFALQNRFTFAAFVPKRMSPDELTAAGFRCRSVFNSVGSIVRRAFDFKTNLRSPARFALYALYNPLFRRETFKKHGMRLGQNDGH